MPADDYSTYSHADGRQPAQRRRRCKGCQQLFPASEFYKDGAGRNALHQHCKACRRSRNGHRKPEPTPDPAFRSLDLFKEDLGPRMRRCAACGETKLLTEFTICRNRKDGIRTECRACRAAYQKRRREDPIDGERVRALERRSNWKYKFRISVEEYNALYEKQGGRCAICGKTEAENGKRFAIDHVHLPDGTAGPIRGLICFCCNVGLGKFGDSIEGLQKAIDYLRRFEEELSHDGHLRPVPC